MRNLKGRPLLPYCIRTFLSNRFALFLFFASLSWQAARAQITTYAFSARSGTYTPITGTAVTVSDLDNSATALIPIGFTFTYNGLPYTELGAHTNGFVRMGAVVTHLSDATYYRSLSQNDDRPIIAPFWDDLRLTSSNGLSYQTSGTMPNRVFTLQWSGVDWFSNAAQRTPNIEFQLKLYEGSNRIEFVYNPLPLSNWSGDLAIGISAIEKGSGNYQTLLSTGANPTVSSTESYMGIRTKPAAGQVYAFTPPAPCSGAPTGGTTVSSMATLCAGYPFTLKVAGASGGTGLSFQWQSSADSISWQDITGATDTNLVRSQTVPTWYRRAMTCSGNTGYATPVYVRVGAAPVQYASLPYLQTFDSTWTSNCATRELPSLHWRNTPLTGDHSWRREDDGAAAGWSSGSNWIGYSTSGHAARFHVYDHSTGIPTTGDLDLYIDCSAAGTKELRFKQLGTNNATHLSVYYSTDGGTNFSLLDNIRGLGVWREEHYVLPSTSAQTIIRFRGNSRAFTGSDDIGLDDVSVQVQTCAFPTGLVVSNITNSSITANWDAVPGAVGYESYVSGYATPPGSGDTVTATTRTYTGLFPTSKYYLHVRAKCGANSFSSWSYKVFTTSMDCSVATTISCGTPTTVNIDYGYGGYDLIDTDPPGSCGGTSYGLEKIFRFKPTISGVYNLKVASSNASYEVHYYLKDAAYGCAPVGWTCLGTTIGPATFSMGTLTAGKEYFILLDNFTVVNSHTEVLEVICPTPTADCSSGTISPATASICPGASQTLSVSGSGTAFQWFRNGVAINGATSNTYMATENGNYTVSITNGTCTSLSGNVATISVTPIFTPTLTPSGPTTFCAGGSVTLYSNAATGTQWLRDSVAIAGATESSYVATQSGSYRLKLTNGSCTALSVPLVVTVNTTPPVPVITTSGATTFCQGGTVTLQSSATTGNQWYNNSILLSGSSAGNLAVTQPGNYTVRVTVEGCTPAISAVTTVTVNTKPTTPSITPGGDTSFCSGGSVNLSSSAATGNQWYRDGAAINGATAVNYTAMESGLYTVTATANNCMSAASPSKNITVKPLPLQPAITLVTGVLQSSAAAGNQWFLNGAPVPGATNSTFTPTVSGQYTVQVSTNGCQSTLSAPYSFVVTSINNPVMDRQVVIAPNPVKHYLIVRYTGNAASFTIQVLDLTGKQLLQQGVFTNTYTMDMKQYSAGLYLVRIVNTRSGDQVQRLVVKE